MKDAFSFEARFARICHAAGVDRDSELARVLGITPQSVSSARNKDKIPSRWVEMVAEQFDVSADWLLYARGPMNAGRLRTCLRKEDFGNEMELIGVNCNGSEGWDKISKLTDNSVLPSLSKEAVAVLVSGSGLVPAGILPGQVLYCDPAVRPVQGEAAYLVLSGADGEKAGVKILKEIRDDSLVLKGWREESKGKFTSYSFVQPTDEMVLIAPVVLVRRRL